MYKNILVFMSMPMLLVSLQRFPLKLERLIHDSNPEIDKTTTTATTSIEKKLKNILLWTDDTYFPHEEGQQMFITNNCKVNSCYFTTNSSIFNGDLSNFDAILFYGPLIKAFGNNLKMPKQRYPHQKYVYVNKESAENYPECTTKFNGFYNWTATYRLDSDIQLRYITVIDMLGNIVAPSEEPTWFKSYEVPLDAHFKKRIMKEIKKKTKAAAWFVSHCKTQNNISREHFVKTLQRELKKYNLTIDIYGKCGHLKCDKKDNDCDLMLKKDYFFYLAFENTSSTDFITEKVFHGFKNRVVPIIFGGADYKRYLPPRSYIDATFKTIRVLAATMHYLIRNPQEYAKYFWWVPFYHMHDGDMLNFCEASCDLCALLNDEEKFKNRSTYNDFRNWWSPNYKIDCAKKETKSKSIPAKMAKSDYTKQQQLNNNNYILNTFLATNEELHPYAHIVRERGRWGHAMQLTRPHFVPKHIPKSLKFIGSSKFPPARAASPTLAVIPEEWGLEQPE